MNKKPDLTAIERLLGSVEYANFVRSVLMLNQDNKPGMVRAVHAKHNLSPQGDDLLFSIHNTRPKKPRGQYIAINWEKPNSNINQDYLFDRKKGDDSAGKWLSQLLEKGEMDCQEIFKKAEGYSHSAGALKQAKLRDPEIGHRTEGFGKERRTFWFKRKLE